MNISSVSTFRDSFRNRHEPEAFVRAAHVVWIWVLISTGTFIVAGISFGVWQFMAPPQTSSLGSSEGGIVGFNKSQLTTLVHFYETKKTMFEEMMSE